MKRFNRKLRFRHIILGILALLMFAAFSFEIQGGTMPKMEITLNGIANGGTVS